MEPASTPFTAKKQGPVDVIRIFSTSTSSSSADGEVYQSKSPPALPGTFYTPCSTRRLRFPKPTLKAKKGKRRFSSEEERAIVERVPLRPGISPATSLFRPVPSSWKVSSQGFLLYQPNPGVNVSEEVFQINDSILLRRSCSGPRPRLQ